MVSRAGTLFIVATPIGNLEDITMRALRVLREVSLIAAEDTRRTAQLLARYAISTPMTSVHEHNEHKKASAVLLRLQQGQDVALVSDAGTPTVSDPGQILVRAAIEAGVRVEPVPGPSAALAALSASGLSTETFTFLGFPPARAKARKEWLERLARTGGTVVFFEAPHRIRETLLGLSNVAGDSRICLARELTKSHEELVRGPILDVLERLQDPRGEYTVVAEIGVSTNISGERVVDPPALLDELGEITKTVGVNRRRAIGILAKRHSMNPNDVYEAIESAKNRSND